MCCCISKQAFNMEKGNLGHVNGFGAEETCHIYMIHIDMGQSEDPFNYCAFEKFYIHIHGLEFCSKLGLKDNYKLGWPI